MDPQTDPGSLQGYFFIELCYDVQLSSDSNFKSIILIITLLYMICIIQMQWLLKKASNYITHFDLLCDIGTGDTYPHRFLLIYSSKQYQHDRLEP